MTYANTIFKNASYLTLASIGQKLISFVYFTLLARFIGAEILGQYTFALSYALLFAVFADFGLTSVLIRDVARGRDNLSEDFSRVISAKIILAVLIIIVTLSSAFFIHKPTSVLLMMVVAIIPAILDVFTLSFWGMLRGLHQLEYEAVAVVRTQALTAILGITAALLSLPTYSLILALACGSAYNFWYAYNIVRRRTGIQFHWIFDWDIARKLMITALPFAFAAIFARMYSIMDQILLSFMAGDIVVGWYAVAYKITFAFQFIPTALAASLYPAMSSAFIHDRDKLANILEQSLFYMYFIAVPIVFGILGTAGPLIVTFYTSNFAESVLPLQIMITGLLFVFPSFPVGSLLNACNRQNVVTWNMALTMVVNVILNILLIPSLGHLGASIASLVGSAVLFLSGYMWISGIVKIDLRRLLSRILKTTVAGVLMLIFLLSFQQLALPLLILLGATLFITCIAMFRIVTVHDVKSFTREWRKSEPNLEV